MAKPKKSQYNKEPKVVDEFDDIEIYKTGFKIMRIGNKAIRNARAENRRLKIPSVYSRNGIIYFELPNGEITTKSPW